MMDGFKKNFLLLFLSSGKKPPAKYSIADGSEPVTTLHSNESAVYKLDALLKSKGEKIDKIFVFSSKATRSELLFDKLPPVLKTKKYEEITVLAKKCFNRDDASEEDHEKLKAILDESNGPTTLDFFKDRIKGIVAPGDVISVPYNENATMDEALSDIGEMGKIVLKELTKIRGENPALSEEELSQGITMHADMTGGMRNASMMMLGVMRLLDFSKLKMGMVLYSNWEAARSVNFVEDSGDVYRFFDLVAGATEFARYGSVEKLTEYYGMDDRDDLAFDEKYGISRQLFELIKAMGYFARSIKLCRYGEFEDACCALSDRISAFEKNGPEYVDANDKIFATLLPTIKESYKKILGPHDDLDIITWCVKQCYLQQAMTLYTERVPEFISDNGFYKLNGKIKKKIKDKIKDDVISESVYVLCRLDTRLKTAPSLKSILREIGEEIKSLATSSDEPQPGAIKVKLNELYESKLAAGFTETNDKLDDRPQLQSYLIEVSKELAGIMDMRKESAPLEEMEARFSRLEDKIKHDNMFLTLDREDFFRAVSEIWDVFHSDVTLEQLLSSPNGIGGMINRCFEIKPKSRDILNTKKSKNEKFRLLLEELKNIKEDQLYKLFDISKRPYYDNSRGYILGIAIDEGMLSCNLKEKKDLVDIINTYTRIRLARNSSNHARHEKGYSVEELEDMLLSGVKELREASCFVKNKS